MTTPVEIVGGIDRVVRTTTRDGQEAKVVQASRTYPSPVEDVWDALTSIERIPRWFAPVSGELEVGGRYQVEGNAGGEVLTCDAPRAFSLTWESMGGVSWVEVTLEPHGEDGTLLRLVHTAHVPEEFWGTYGPGAVGTGWDLSLLGLHLHLGSGGASITQDHGDEWAGSDEGRAVVTASSRGWADALIADGTDESAARAAEAATTAFYTGVPQEGAEPRGPARLMHAFDVLGDPVRRRILELLASGELTSGAVTEVVREEFGISQPAVSQHLKVLRENGFATVRPRRHAAALRRRPGRAAGGRRVGAAVQRVLGAEPGRARHRARARATVATRDDLTATVPAPGRRLCPRRPDRRGCRMAG